MNLGLTNSWHQVMSDLGVFSLDLAPEPDLPAVEEVASGLDDSAFRDLTLIWKMTAQRDQVHTIMLFITTLFTPTI